MPLWMIITKMSQFCHCCLAKNKFFIGRDVNKPFMDCNSSGLKLVKRTWNAQKKYFVDMGCIGDVHIF